jgi:hypothetical protein
MDINKIITSTICRLEKGFEIVQPGRTSDKNRIVWLIAIIGFIIVNYQIFIDPSKVSVNKFLTVIFFLLWLTTALLLLATDIFYDRLISYDNTFYVLQVGSLEALQNTVLDPKILTQRFLKIISAKEPKIKKAKKMSDKWSSIISNMQTSSYILFGTSMLFSFSILVMKLIR